MWRTDFTYLKGIGGGWFYLSSFSLHHRLDAMRLQRWREDVTDTLDLPLAASGGDEARVEHHPRLFSENLRCYIEC